MATAIQSRPDAVAELRRFGIEGPDVYLLDLVPLIEMMWADGVIQDAELRLLEKFVERHVASINGLARTQLLSLDRAHAFVKRFCDVRPDEELLKALRALVPIVSLNTSDPALNATRAETILAFCIDIAAACVTEYPYDDQARFNEDEKRCFQETLEVLSKRRGGKP